MRESLLAKPLLALVPALAVLFTLATGNWSSNGIGYGFPLAWKTVVVGRGGCPPGPVEIACFLIPSSTVYNWSFFVLDTAFYLALGYSPLLADWGTSQMRPSLSRLLARIRLRWRELATPFKVSSVMGILVGAYFAYLPLWILVGLSAPNNTDGPIGPPFDVFSVAEVPFLALSLISIGGAVVLLTQSMNEDRRGILALFVTVGSFFPLAYLSLQIAYWIMTLWEYAIIAILWSTLLFMAARVVAVKQRADKSSR